jgi:hypothetical protein
VSEENRNGTPSQRPDVTTPTSPRDDPPGGAATALVDRPGIKTFLAVAGFVIAVSGLAVAVWVNFLRPAPVPGGSSDPSAAPTTSGQQPGGSSASLAVGQCFSVDWTETGCNVRHHWELVDMDPPCNPEQALSYLGGIPGIDVLAVDVEPVAHRVGGQGACFLGLPGGDALTTSIRDALRERTGDVWRWCIDDRVAREVPCSAVHTAEVVGPPASGDLTCPAQADRYAETSLSRFSLDLSVSSRGPEGHEQCVIAVRGENVLTHSIRHLGSGAPPIEPE